MNGYVLINNLAGLLIITSLLVIAIRRPTRSAVLYAVQSLVLVVIFFCLGAQFHASELYLWGVTSLITKVILVPIIMYAAFRAYRDNNSLGGIVSAPLIIIFAVIIMIVCYVVVRPVQLPLLVDLKPAFAVSLGHFFIGILCIVSQRSILKQVFGYCLMENGAHLTLGLLAFKAPELVEVGIATDAIFAVIIMVLLVRLIYRSTHSLDVKQLMTLKG